MTKILDSLREETSVLHKELEKDNLANKIMDHSIKLEEYKLLLFQNFIAYKSAESQIAKFLAGYNSDKSVRLENDLIGLGFTDFTYDLNFSCTNEAEAIGAAYVIEGSAMGGMLIGKEVSNCKSLNAIPEQEFFNGNKSNVKAWNNYLKFLRSRDFTNHEIDQASAKAKETFLLFKDAFKVQFSNSY